MVLVFIIIFFSFGLIIGSFLNVVVCRINTKRSLSGRSACMSCENKLRWHELIPLFSFFVLMGRCKTCKTKISIQYPLVEIASGIIFSALFFKFQNIFLTNTLIFSITYIYYAFMFSLLLVIATYDLKHKIIPDKLSFIFGILAFIGLFLFRASLDFHPHVPSILEFLSGILIALPFALLWLVSRGAWMGLGDPKLILGLSWLLGLGVALSGVVVAFWSGAIVGIFLIILKKDYEMKSEIPFAPYLVLGAFSAFVLDLHLFGI
ncbi:hypothetical protein A2814_02065 [Candidatus Nomurabacteria bacterium RIFCSPHIGHO2_01_FULL_38_19]|uniref:Peptidase A24A N-terminal domain-containing protein n=1 Tax=Candidatus Nomurabacteria bacterium RIFCSPHIGHO2_01_FULL_38_19 TaxID=1801732 RepID=A0A1F6UUV3_9BACT|nr:MAG: hypothetical protein A2814_02065 [Candidatus Nomurabacteria bacterium RIFCSPHIGHO2_01_FULL_38_19]